MKKLLCIFVALSVIIASFGTLASIVLAEDDPFRDTYGTDIPTIYISGQGHSIYDAEGNVIYPFDFSGVMDQATGELLPKYKTALFSQDWDEFLDSVYDIFSPIFNKLALDENGDVTNGSHTDWSWSRNTIENHKINGRYPVHRYYFRYDWRADPFESAKSLHQYIEDVLYATGNEKVELIGRCLGGSIANAYFYLYDGEYIDSYLQYASASQGAVNADKLFSGDLGLDPDLLENMLIDNYLGLDEDINDFVVSVLTILNKTYGLDLICHAFNKTYNDIYMDIVPRLMGESFGTFPGYWSMVSDYDNSFERAKEVLLFSRGYTEDSPLVKRIDDYHYNVQQKIGEIFKRLENEKGIRFCNITKYGYSPLGFFMNSDHVSDQTCFVSASSNGATTSTVRGILSPYYLFKARLNNRQQYISPDLKIDASTCLYPDTTWFIKDLLHSDFPDFVESFMADILNDNNMTVFSNEKYPQFLAYNEEKQCLDPLSKDNMYNDLRYNTTLIGALIIFYRQLPKIMAMLQEG